MTRPRPYDVIAIAEGTLVPTGEPGTADRCVEEDTAETLWRLHDAGHQLILSANTRGRSWRPALQKAGVDPVWCAYVESHAVGAAKPARAFYDQLVAVAGCPPSRILHVGRIVDADILVPIRLGMSAVYLCRYRKPDMWLPERAAHIRRFADLPALLADAGEAR